MEATTEIRQAALGLDPDLPAGALPDLPVPAKIGRPRLDFDDGIAQRVLEAIAEGKTVAQICAADPSLPKRSTIYRWRLMYPEFERAFIFAQWCWADELDDRCIDIVLDTSHDTTLEIGADGDVPIHVVNEAHMKRQKMQLAEFHRQSAKKAPSREAPILPAPPVPRDDAKEINPKTEAKMIDEDPLAASLREWQRHAQGEIAA